MPKIGRDTCSQGASGVSVLSALFFGIMNGSLGAPPLQKENHGATCQISKRSVIRFVDNPIDPFDQFHNGNHKTASP